jgi:hypothetical protein
MMILTASREDRDKVTLLPLARCVIQEQTTNQRLTRRSTIDEERVSREGEAPLRDIARLPGVAPDIYRRGLRLVVGRAEESSTALTSIDGPPSSGFPLFWMTARCLETSGDGTVHVDPVAREHAVSLLQTWADQNNVRIV